MKYECNVQNGLGPEVVQNMQNQRDNGASLYNEK